MIVFENTAISETCKMQQSWLENTCSNP